MDAQGSILSRPLFLECDWRYVILLLIFLVHRLQPTADVPEITLVVVRVVLRIL